MTERPLDIVGATKVAWRGLVVSVQPRIRLTRSFDQSSHSYLGFLLRIYGQRAGVDGEFSVGIGKAAQEKHQLRRGDIVSGMASAVRDAELETADLYKVSRLELVERASADGEPGPPFHTIAPPLLVYRERGHRRLDAQTFAESCVSCVWGCEMAVEMIIDHWNPSVRRYRRETFCYGPLSCRLYKAGPRRRVPGRKGMVYTEPDWVDEDAVGDRGSDD